MTIATSSLPAQDVAAACQTAAAHRDHGEQTGELHPAVWDALSQCDLARACLPQALGGLEVAPPHLLEVVTALARADASAGWAAAIHAPAGIFAGLLPEAAAAAVVGDATGKPVWIGGSSQPGGTAVRVPGGFRLSGSWSLVTGAHRLDVAFLAARLSGPAEESQRVAWLCLRRGDWDVQPDWAAHGLRGTDSATLTVQDVTVVAEHIVDLAADQTGACTPLSRFPRFGLLACCLAAVAAGTAEHAQQVYGELAGRHQPRHGVGTLADQPAAQITAAACTARLTAARLYLTDAVNTAWQAALTGPVSEALRAALRLAAAETTSAAITVTRDLFEACGSAAVYANAELEGCMRDLAVIGRHALLAAPARQRAGRYLLTSDCAKDL